MWIKFVLSDVSQDKTGFFASKNTVRGSTDMTKKKLLSLALALALTLSLAACGGGKADQSPAETPEDTQAPEDEIGRASCRERV